MHTPNGDEGPAVAGQTVVWSSCRALATDYDGTIATHGVVDDATLEALRKFRASGRTLIMVTGRRMEELKMVFPHVQDFDCIVAENGATLYWPKKDVEELLAPAPDPIFVERLKLAGVDPILLGGVIVATFEPHDKAVFDAIKDLGLELQVIFNKGAVMVLPTGINKATGLKEALKILGIPSEIVVGVGDAENDHALLSYCGFSAAVANALPVLKEHAMVVLRNHHGAGVAELTEMILQNVPTVEPSRGEIVAP